MKVIIGADGAGFELKQQVQQHLAENKDIELIDIGMTSTDKSIPYYEVSATAARKIQAGEADRGILFCGTGMGVAVTANKFKGIYASVVESELTGVRSKLINNANVLTMGGWIVSPYVAKRICDNWLKAPFAGGEMEKAGDFLKGAFAEIQAIENENFK